MTQEMIPMFKVQMSDQAAKKAGEVINSGFVGQGPKVEEFEAALKQKFNNLLTLTVNSATSGLHLATHLLKKPYGQTWPGLEEGDEVLTCPLTCTATNWPALANGLRLKWVDVDPETCNMDLDDLERKITSKTKVIILVHWGGNPIDLDRVKEIQEKAQKMFGFKPAVIEDCAHAMNTTFNRFPLGNHGNICVYSFQAIKHFTSVDGGCMILPHAELYKRAKLLRWYGIDREASGKDFRCEDDIPEWGFKFHMNDLNASIGLANMPLIDETVDAHRANSQAYLNNIFHKYVKEVRFAKESAQWIHTLRVDSKYRDEFMTHLKSKGISCSRVHERNDKHSCVKGFKSMLPGIDLMASEMVCIPNGWWLTEGQVRYIIETINGWTP
tara:strand:- start:151137 stop:152288 length:1152 start_codon:yes stop_codon:yes gene_type:complete